MKKLNKQRFSRPWLTKLTTFGASLVFSLCTTQSALANVNLAQVPLFLKESVDPNLLFVFDDSGSMGWDWMPDSIGRDFILAIDEKGPFEWSEGDFKVRAENFWYYSSRVNAVYYDPDTEYTAPINPNGSGRLANSNFNAAWRNGYDKTGSVDLSILYPSTRYTGDFDNSAFYYRFNPSEGCEANPKQNSCYTLVFLKGESDQQKQNFANWYSYYRTRLFATRAGVSEAFFDLPENIRLGYGAINSDETEIDGVDTRTLISGVRPFTTTRREQFLSWLQAKPVSGGTPLRRALKDAGEYYSRADNRGPWGNEPGTNDTSAHLECRQSYTILMSDGTWNGSSPDVGNPDGTPGPSHTNPKSGGSDFNYQAVSPFADSYSNTLADVAMKYWKTDLRPTLANRVPTASIDEAFWQHMTTFTIGLGVEGSVSAADAFAAISTGDQINWPEPFANAGQENIDDLLHAAINGRGGYASAQNPTQFSTAIQGFLKNVIARSETSATSAAVSSAVLRTNTLGYFAGFRSDDWSGTLSGFNLKTGEKIWDAENKLANTLPANRKLITFNGTAAVELAFDSATSISNLSTAQQNALNADPAQANLQDNLGYKRLAWLHGDNPADPSFRDRTSQNENGETVTRLLGDIVNANPQFAGNSNYGYRSLEGVEGEAYGAFRSTSSYQNRTKALYVAANDGILHAFDSETGTELFGYIPSELLLPAGSNTYARISKLMKPNYTHEYFMDGTPHIQDAYIDKNGNGSKQWRTLLIGTMGSGGRTVFALDITDPDSFSASEDVLWEFQHPNLGFGVKDSQIARLDDGRWVAIFGNGYNGDTHQSSLFVVDLSDGSLIKELATGVGSAVIPNGLATATVGSFPEKDAITRYAYAGDLLGNLWRFDLTGRESSWAASKLFTAAGPSGSSQPITTAPRVVINPNNSKELVVAFGTGSFLRSGDESDDNFQTFYAIRDDQNEIGLTRANLLKQTITTQETVRVEQANQGFQIFTLRDTSSNELTNEKGWYLDLAHNGIRTGERIISSPTLPFGVFSDRVRFTTVIPDKDPCGSSRTGFLMDLKLTTGEKSERPVFDLNGDGQFNTGDIVNGYPASGIQWGKGEELRTIADPSPQGESEVLIGEPGEATCETGLCARSLESGIGRQTWEQLR